MRQNLVEQVAGRVLDFVERQAVLPAQHLQRALKRTAALHQAILEVALAVVVQRLPELVVRAAVGRIGWNRQRRQHGFGVRDLILHSHDLGKGDPYDTRTAGEPTRASIFCCYTRMASHAKCFYNPD